MTMLLQWLWQGSAIAMALWIALRCAPGINAATRYALWWVALGVVLLLPFVTHLTAFGSGLMAPLGPVSPVSMDPGSLTPDALHVAKPLVALPAPPDWLLACGIGAWLGSVLLGFGRLRRGLATVRQLKQRSRRVSVSVARSLSLWRQWRRAGRRRAALRVSSSVSGACALGLLGRPVIVLSDRLVTTLDPDDLDLIVLHEQVHLARYDDWATLLQSCVRVFVGWHPAVRVITTALDAEREAACDDAVAARIGNAARYARCLADAADVIAARRLSPAHAMAPHAAGTGSLLLRVQRLLDPRVRQRAALQRVALGSGIAGLAMASVVATAVGPIVGAEAPAGTMAHAIPSARPTPPVDVSNAVHSTDVGRSNPLEWVVLVNRRPSTPAPGAGRSRAARTASAMMREATLTEPALTGVIAPTQVAQEQMAGSSVTPVPPVPASLAVSDPGLPPIEARVLADKPVRLVDVSFPAADGAVSSAALGTEPSVWTAVGRQVAREGATVGQELAQRSSTFGQQVARRSGALGSFFGRAGKAVAGQF